MKHAHKPTLFLAACSALVTIWLTITSFQALEDGGGMGPAAFVLCILFWVVPSTATTAALFLAACYIGLKNAEIPATDESDGTRILEQRSKPDTAGSPITGVFVAFAMPALTGLIFMPTLLHGDLGLLNWFYQIFLSPFAIALNLPGFIFGGVLLRSSLRMQKRHTH